MADKAYHIPHATEPNKTVCGRCKALKAGQARTEKVAAKHRKIREAASAAKKDREPGKRQPALLALGERMPNELRVTFKGKEYLAAVNPDGTILVEGHEQPFNSPSRAGKAITGREVDGWTFWSYVKKDGNLASSTRCGRRTRNLRRKEDLDVSRVYKILSKTSKTRWYICVTYRGQRYREVGGDTKQAALKRLRELEARLEKTGKVAEKKVPFDFLCDEYLRWTQINLAPQTRRERVIAVRAHLKPFFTGLAGDIDVRSVEAYKALRMSKGISPWTMNNELKVLSCILKFGVENKYLEEIPRIRRVKIQKKSPRFLSAEEIGKVLAAARPDARPMLQIMIFTGLRKGEIRHLEWSDVDLSNRLLHVRPKETWGPKTESSARTVPLCDPAVEALQMAWERAEKRNVKSSLVFPGRKGPLNDIRESLNGACERAGVPHIRVHGLRHTFGSQMAMAGADPFAIMKAMGHTDIKTTMIYVSLGKSNIREQVEKLNGIRLLPPPAPRMKTLPALGCIN